MVCSALAYHCLTLLAVSALWYYCEVLLVPFCCRFLFTSREPSYRWDTLSSSATAYYRLSSSAGPLDVSMHLWDVGQFMAEHRPPKAAMRSPIPIVFVWSSSSAVNGSRARTNVRRRRRRKRRKTWRSYWSTNTLHASMQFDFRNQFYGKLTAV